MTYAIKTNSCRKDGSFNRIFRYIFNTPSFQQPRTPTTNHALKIKTVEHLKTYLHNEYTDYIYTLKYK